MKDFPKKYNYHIIEKEIELNNEKNRENKIISDQISFITSPVPISPELHLWNLFSLTYSDVLKRFLEISNNENFSWNLWFYCPQFFKSASSKNILNIKTSYDKKKSNWKQIKKTWLSFYDSLSPYSVMDQDFMFNVRNTFLDLYRRWKIYEDKRIVYRSHIHQSVIWNDDVEVKQIKWKKYNIRFFIETKNDSIVISTPYPHTIFSDVALLVNPQDKRYKKFIWSNVLIPIINKPIPIIADESVDTLKDNWIFRVTPCHDELWLSFAKKYNLPTDICSIDDKWNFTSITWIFSDKKVDDFFDNIIQYLSDISNLDSVLDHEYEIPVLKKTWENLYKMLKTQRFLKFSEEEKEKFRDTVINSINIFSKENEDQIIRKLNETDTRCISKQYWFWQQLPVWQDTIWRVYIMDHNDIINKLIKTKKTKKVIMTLIIFNLILDGYLQPQFSIDTLVDSLFSPSGFSGKTIIEYYIELFNKLLSKNPKTKIFLQEIKDLKLITQIIEKTRQSSLEKIQSLLDILKKSYLIDSIWEDYYFQINDLLDNRYKTYLQDFVFDPYFLRCFWTVYISKLSKNHSKWILSTWEDNIDFVIKSWLISFVLDEDIIFNKVFFHPILLNDKNNAVSINDNLFLDSKDILKNYSKDAFRLSLMVNLDQNNFTYNPNDLDISQKFLDKFWNASRFIIKNFNQSKKPINLKKIKKDIESNFQNLHEIDIRLIYKFKELLETLSSNLSKWEILSVCKDIVVCIKDNLFDRYLEIIKENKSDITSKVAIYHLILSLKIINPYIPFLTNKISQILLVNLDEIHMGDLNLNTDNINKNYKIHLLFDIISKISHLRTINCLKQHENIDIIIQANTDFIELIQIYENLLKKLLKIKNIEFIRPHQQIPNNYQTDSVVNIIIWFKLSDYCSDKSRLQILIDQVEEKQNYLQNIRSILSSIKAIPLNKEEIDKKTKEMKKIKKEILDIECQINNLRVNK